MQTWYDKRRNGLRSGAKGAIMRETMLCPGSARTLPRRVTNLNWRPVTMDILRPDFPDNNPDAEMIRLAVERLEAMSAAVEKTKNVSSPNSPPFNNCIKGGKA